VRAFLNGLFGLIGMDFLPWQIAGANFTAEKKIPREEI
jgi:hypothetical protein